MRRMAETPGCAQQLVWLLQMGTLGAGNHYAEIQVVEEVFDKAAARKMGIDRIGQVPQA